MKPKHRGLDEVAQKLREILTRLLDNRLHADLGEMLRSHEAHIALAKEVAASPECRNRYQRPLRVRPRRGRLQVPIRRPASSSSTQSSGETVRLTTSPSRNMLRSIVLMAWKRKPSDSMK
jgi:hypothetical protein